MRRRSVEFQPLAVPEAEGGDDAPSGRGGRAMERRATAAPMAGGGSERSHRLRSATASLIAAPPAKCTGRLSRATSGARPESVASQGGVSRTTSGARPEGVASPIRNPGGGVQQVVRSSRPAYFLQNVRP